MQLFYRFIDRKTLSIRCSYEFQSQSPCFLTEWNPLLLWFKSSEGGKRKFSIVVGRYSATADPAVCLLSY